MYHISYVYTLLQKKSSIETAAVDSIETVERKKECPTQEIRHRRLTRETEKGLYTLTKKMFFHYTK